MINRAFTHIPISSLYDLLSFAKYQTQVADRLLDPADPPARPRPPSLHHDRFSDGCFRHKELVDVQLPDGHWTDWTHDPRELIGTCFALLFLDRATLAVAVTGPGR